MSTTAQTDNSPTFAEVWQRWHDEHEARRAEPTGFLAVTGLHWVTDVPRRLPDAPGVWHLADDGPVVELDPAERLVIDGEELRGHHEFGSIGERESRFAEFDGGVLEIARRGGRYILRPRRGDHAFLSEYSGTPTYDPDIAWKKDARYTAFDEPRAVEVGAAVEGLSHVYEAPGQLTFSHGGDDFALTAFPVGESGELLVLFTDATSGVTTYGANRSLRVPAPDEDGATVLDFNRAVNLPCAYTDFATCPLPPQENRLPVAVESGEKTPESRVEGRVTEAGIVALP